MIKREKSIELLNKAVAEELAAVHQYMYFHFRLDDMGYDFLANQFKRTGIAEMMHAEKLAERILFLKGEVEMKVAFPVEKIHDVKGMLVKAEQMEADTINHYNQWAKECAEQMDSATKSLFEELVVEEETHQDNFDTEIGNMDNFGDNYLALQSIERSRNLAQGTSAEK